jgi:hypothetical protein
VHARARALADEGRYDHPAVQEMQTADGMKYPKIPHCEHFDCGRFIIPTGNGSHTIRLDAPEIDKSWRKIIAAVAEIEWRKKAESVDRSNARFEEWIDSADAWRAWGEA